MKESEDPIFNHIKDVLRNHEEPYDAGAWERFTAGTHKKKPAPVRGIWKWLAVAAAVTGAVLVLPRLLSVGGSEEETLVAESDISVQRQADSVASEAGEAEILAASPHLSMPSAPEQEGNMPVYNRGARETTTLVVSTVAPLISTPNLTRIPATATAPVSKEELVAGKPGNNNPSQPEIDFWKSRVVDDKKDDKPPVSTNAGNDILIVSSATAGEKRKSSEKGSRWQPSLFISPVFGDLGVNMGYGVSLAYAVNDKLSIRSGVAHTKISSSRSYPTDAVGATGYTGAPVNGGVGGATGAVGSVGGVPGKAALSEAGKLVAANSYVTGPQQVSTLQQIEGAVSGIDIPVEVNYTINRKFYASAGISGLVVIDDNRKYTYLDSRNETVSIQSSQGVVKENKSVTFSQQSITSEPIKTAYEYAPFLGFYNVAVGFKQKLSDKNAVAIEPFIKVPVKNTGQQGLNYTGTGVRLKFDF